jgi:hypothetical protein
MSADIMFLVHNFELIFLHNHCQLVFGLERRYVVVLLQLDGACAVKIECIELVFQLFECL